MTSQSKSKALDAGQVRDYVEGPEIQGRIREDGGDIRFDRLEGDTVHVVMTAACAACPARKRTIRHFVEPALRRKFSRKLSVQASYRKHYYMP